MTDLDTDIDDLFQKAIDLVTQYDRVSASLLQRRLSIGYARAARIMDQLENAGVIGPLDNSSMGRMVIIRSHQEYLEKGGKPPTIEREPEIEKPIDYITPKNIKLTRVAQTPWEKQLSDVYGSDAYKKSKTEYPVILGYDRENILQTKSLAEIGNVIVVGNPQSRKETWLDTALTTLLLKYSPNELKLLLIGTNHYFDLYNGIPHLLSPPIYEYGKSSSAFKWLLVETDRRMRIFSEAGVRSYDAFIELSGFVALPRILTCAIADLKNEEVTDNLINLSGQCSNAGIHLFLAVDRLSNVNLSPDVKANIPSRAIFTVTSAQDSSFAGVKGAETLKSGEMLYVAGSGEPNKYKVVCTPEVNISETVRAINKAYNQ